MLVSAFKQVKALVRAFSVIVKIGCGTDGALLSTTEYPGDPQYASVPIKTVKILCSSRHLYPDHWLLLLGTVGPSLRRSWQLRSHPGAASSVNTGMKCYFLLTAHITDLVFRSDRISSVYIVSKLVVSNQTPNCKIFILL